MKVWLSATLILLLAAVPAPSPAGESTGVLVLGRITTDPKTHYEPLKALLDYVVVRMADVGIREGQILMAADAQQMASYLRRGRVDWVTETAGGAMLLQRLAGAEILALSERNGVARYRTIYFARSDSGLRSIEDLRGRSIAFQNRTSTSAYFVPAMELLERGMALEILNSPTDRSAPGSVGYVFARTEQNISTWVHKRFVDVGVVSDLDWSDPGRVPDLFKRDFTVLRESPDFPRGLELVRRDLDGKVRERLREVLLAAGSDPAAIVELGRFHSGLQFAELDAAVLRELATLRKGVDRVGAEIE
ncbi:MAG: PhnD/SsuA/transferrin family substrate-binding protein [Dokdonella sp.]